VQVYRIEITLFRGGACFLYGREGLYLRVRLLYVVIATRPGVAGVVVLGMELLELLVFEAGDLDGITSAVMAVRVTWEE